MRATSSCVYGSPVFVRPPVGIDQSLELLRYVQLGSPGIAHARTIQDTKPHNVSHMCAVSGGRAARTSALRRSEKFTPENPRNLLQMIEDTAGEPSYSCSHAEDAPSSRCLLARGVVVKLRVGL